MLLVTHDRYGSDVLSGDWRVPKRGRSTEREAEVGMVLEEVQTDFCGAVTRTDRDLGTVELEDRRGKRRTFPLGPGFLLEGKPVILKAPVRAAAPARPTHTASGSVAVHDAKARIARASRIYVEGRHDAELVEKVWGDDLRIEGVAVEYLEGVDDLPSVVAQFKPGHGRRLGVLVDHLVPGSKESRIAASVLRGPYKEHVLVVGHPYVDIWQSVKPDRLGLAKWPMIPRTMSWKHGICQALGWPHRNQADIAHAWKRILGTVSSYADLEPALLGRVEELIDFVTQPTAG
ncbi:MULTISPECIES: DUF3097 domain-containing protein [Mumia]|uniref:DUF3097 domain-containing protein n=1 Tax=Mumia TaxID=1546255 RepID=UPI00141E73C7|nr:MULTISPECIES: DUF3097 domain-containing protein [unclassified Mumia]QMW67592.1 DUF3097 domain-containing protein [Mumia sp. ZJ1417]